MKLTWKIEGDALAGYIEADNPFTAYLVKETTKLGRNGYLTEAWRQTGKTPELVGTFAGPQCAMMACEADADAQEAGRV